MPQLRAVFHGPLSNPWGEAVNVDGHIQTRSAGTSFGTLFGGSLLPRRRLRLDAVHGIFDTTARPFLRELSEATDALGRRLGRPLHLVAESADNNPRSVTGLHREAWVSTHSGPTTSTTRSTAF